MPQNTMEEQALLSKLRDHALIAKVSDLEEVENAPTNPSSRERPPHSMVSVMTMRYEESGPYRTQLDASPNWLNPYGLECGSDNDGRKQLEPLSTIRPESGNKLREQSETGDISFHESNKNIRVRTSVVEAWDINIRDSNGYSAEEAVKSHRIAPEQLPANLGKTLKTQLDAPGVETPDNANVNKSGVLHKSEGDEESDEEINNFSPVLTLEDMQYLQRADPQLNEIIIYLQSGQLPVARRTARLIALTADQYTLQDNILYHFFNQGRNTIFNTTLTN